MIEIWREIEGYDGKYQVSNLGRIWSNKSKQYLKSYPANHGYLRLTLYGADGKPKGESHHRLVARAFCPNPNGYTEVNHIDEDKTNNNASNLEWCSRERNCNHGTRNSRGAAKRCVAIRCIETGQEYSSTRAAAKELGCGRTGITKQLKGVIRTTGGHTFEYM